MKIGPKYKIARRLGVAVFEKTQTQKFVLSESRKSKPRQKGRRSRSRTNFAVQMLEKQKARYTYLITEKQFSSYVKKAIGKKGTDSAQNLYQRLELRLDNAVFRIGLVPTRSFARQIVSHGHIYVNGRRVTIPSFALSAGDVISIRPSSADKGIFVGLEERLQGVTLPNWLAVGASKREWKVSGLPTISVGELMFDINAVLEFYSR